MSQWTDYSDDIQVCLLRVRDLIVARLCHSDAANQVLWLVSDALADGARIGASGVSSASLFLEAPQATLSCFGCLILS